MSSQMKRLPTVPGFFRPEEFNQLLGNLREAGYLVRLDRGAGTATASLDGKQVFRAMQFGGRAAPWKCFAADGLFAPVARESSTDAQIDQAERYYNVQ